MSVLQPSPRPGQSVEHPWSQEWADLDGPVHYLDFGGPQGAPVILAVHGLGGNAVNWAAMAPLLAKRYRVMAVDLGGFGHTEAGSRGSSVTANQRLVDAFISQVIGEPAILMGNSMGGMISLMQAAENPSSVRALILVDAALPLVVARPDPLVTGMFAVYAVPGIGSMLMRARRRIAPSAEVAVDQVLSLCTVDKSRVPAEVRELHVKVAEHRMSYLEADVGFLEAARSLITIEARRGAYKKRLHAIGVPVLMIHGEKDRLIPVAAARAAARAHPTWTLVTMPDIGHVPMLEAAEKTHFIIEDWLDNEGRTATASGDAAATAE